MTESKQKRILNAGYKVFAMHPYKKASMSKIADESLISKSLLFHYFKNKKELYLYLFESAVHHLERAKKEMMAYSESDFFQVIFNEIKIRIELMEYYPYIYQFVTTAYYESDEIVLGDIMVLKDKIIAHRKQNVLDKIDKTKFKNPKDIDRLFDIIIYFSEGYMLRKFCEGTMNVQKLQSEVLELLENLKVNYYKEGIGEQDD